MKFNQIETKRLIIREMTDDDEKALYEVLKDSDIRSHYPYIFNEERVKNWINKNKERYQKDGFGLWSVCLKENKELIGDCGITKQNINGEIKEELGYHIRKDMRNQGYAKEAAIAVRDWFFQNADNKLNKLSNFNKIYSYTSSKNIASIKTAMAYGAHFEYSYNQLNEKNEKEEIIVLSLNKEEVIKNR